MDAKTRQNYYPTSHSNSFTDFVESVQRTAVDADYPLAASIIQNTVAYDSDTVLEARKDAELGKALKSEWIKVWADGPGVLKISNAMPASTIDTASAIFESIIDEEKKRGLGAGDHFAKPGANDRIWNALEKHANYDAVNFTQYYSNAAIAMVCEAWLGHGYQITAQVNRVNPGGAAQAAHRDYHLGFMSTERAASYPLHVHKLSPALTLQGAIAHCDMPLDTGPTLYLPFSQHFDEGYVEFQKPEYQEYFNKNHTQLALNKGDVVFFNPALMHAAGHNRTQDRFRLANLLQVSSAFGKTMEAIDNFKLVESIYPTLLEMKTSGALDANQVAAVVATCADGYAFPTNLDTDLPSDGLAPTTQLDLVARAIKESLPPEQLIHLMTELRSRKA